MKVQRLFSCFVVLVAAAVSVYGQEATATYRTKIGSLEVIAFQDGLLKLNPAGIRGVDQDTVRNLLGSADPVPTAVNAFVVRTGGHTVLIDAGGRGAALGGELGHVPDLLRKAGISPDSIEAVLITHLHFDHVDGLITADGQRAFPHAVVTMAQTEYDYWMDPAREAGLSKGMRAMLRQAKVALAPYQKQGAFRTFAQGETPFPGVTAVPVPGHTPGHTAYTLGRGKNAIWFVGDIIHYGKVQFARPEATASSDTDAAQAAATRIELLKRAAKSKAILAGSHVDFTGMGRVVVKASGFEWIPLSR